MPIKLSTVDIEEYYGSSARVLLSPEVVTDDEAALKITGVEILVFMAAKVALPILCGFVANELYNKWNRPVTRADLDALRDELVGKTVNQEPIVPRETLLANAVEKLQGEGLPEERAQQVAEEILNLALAVADPSSSARNNQA